MDPLSVINNLEACYKYVVGPIHLPDTLPCLSYSACLQN